ncbi:MAG: aromatic amino acid ammonia-lyase [Desulfurococcales archaeon]|nr:aromatic amino acid ammonia-lyase [Desulfurococcales archaeon]
MRLLLTECGLSRRDIVDIALSKKSLKISEYLLARFEESRRTYLEEANKRRVYGYCTGLGELYSKSSGCPSNWEEIVLEEHAAGVGPYIASRELVRAFYATRLVQLSKGPAPVRSVVVQRIAEALERDIIPVVHISGSVGASGDLAPSAEAFRCIFYGKGEALVDNKRIPCSKILKDLGLPRLDLEPGEALALINNTAFSTSYCMLALHSLERIYELLLDTITSAVSLISVNPEHFYPEVLSLKHCEDGKGIAEKLYNVSKQHRDYLLQAPYSIRCVPQILGTVKNLMDYSGALLNRELCGATENPIVVNDRVYHACNFHSIRAGTACDIAALAGAHMANLIDRFTAQIMRKELNRIADFLSGENSSVGLMILQYTTASLASKIRSLATPFSIQNSVTSGLQEDIVPMSPNSAKRLEEIVESLAGMLAVLGVVVDFLERGEKGPFIGIKEKISEKLAEVRRSLILPLSLPEDG